jgi:hypothetical protein
MFSISSGSRASRSAQVAPRKSLRASRSAQVAPRKSLRAVNVLGS